ncbi:tetraspanin-4, putative [Pediculus humanus corporis]|uniref:Tetraspanin n=1 Tax=Pediculus humanus subsp. corporis TaxID=121224 RepID=E0VNP9_PEDHC|nr:tetraspanin-4, putative [Pediculus humanus corporis]EEB15005.1 tetraspanin-4, putative [Pediculus humanus corporis]
MRNACGTALKYVLFFSNLIIWIGGLVAVGIATWLLVNSSSIRNFLGTNLLSSAVYILLVTGVVASLMSFFGCIGAIKEIKFILVIYFIILFIIFTVMLAGGILGYIFIETVKNTMETEMYNTMKLYGKTMEVTRDWDHIQTTFSCCGVNNQKDWLKLGNVPESCRIKPTEHHQVATSEFYVVGCLNTTITYIQKHSELIGGSGITIACLMILGMFFSWSLYMIIE